MFPSTRVLYHAARVTSRARAFRATLIPLAVAIAMLAIAVAMVPLTDPDRSATQPVLTGPPFTARSSRGSRLSR